MGVIGIILRSPRFVPAFRRRSSLFHHLNSTLSKIPRCLSSTLNPNLVQIFNKLLKVKLRSTMEFQDQGDRFWTNLRKNHPDLQFRLADKNLGIAVLDKTFLETAEHNFLLSEDCLRTVQVNTNPKQLLLLCKQYKIPKPPLKPAGFYLMPKLHKPTLKWRPIFSASSCYTTTISRELHRTLQGWMKQLPYTNIVQDTRQVLQHLDNFQPLPGSIVVSADFSDLYMKLKRKDIQTALEHFANFLKVSDQERKKTFDLLQVLWDFCLFSYADTLYHQTDGIPMGTNCGPDLANLTLLYRNHFASKQPTYLFLRYIDDCFFIGKLTIWERIASRFPSYLNLPTEVGQEGIFLDVHVTLKEDHIVSKLYRKPSFNFNYLSYKSKHPLSTKVAWVRQEFYRIMMIYNSSTDYYHFAQEFVNKLKRLHYPSTLLEIPLWSIGDHLSRLYPIHHTSNKKPDVWITWPIELQHQLQDSFQDCAKILPTLSYKTPREAITLSPNLFRVLSRPPRNTQS